MNTNLKLLLIIIYNATNILPMKNELGFIPDTISAISGISMHIQHNLNFEPGQQHQDSTDMFIDEILRQRVEKVQKEQEKMESGFLSNLHSKALLEAKELPENMNVSEHKLKQSLKTSGHKLNKLEMLMRQNESIAQKSQVSEVNDSESESKEEPVKKNLGDFTKKQAFMIEERIDMLQNQTNQQNTIKKQLNQSLKFPGEKIEEMLKISDHFQLPEIDQIDHFQLNNASKKSSQFVEKEKEENSKKSIVLSQKQNSKIHKSAQDYNFQQKKVAGNYSSIKRQQYNENFQKQIKQKSNSSKKPQTNKKLSNIEVKIQKANSMIEEKGIMMETPIKMFNQPVGFYQFVQNKNNPLNQQAPYRQIAIAITDQLNKIQRIQPPKRQNEVQFSLVAQNKSKSSNSRNLSVKEQGSSQKKDSLKLDFQQDDLQTEYSEFSRETKILQHRCQSNNSYLQAQTKELLGYYNFMIMQQQKKELRKLIMKQQIANNQLKIQHRTASFTKRFNFISPIAKTNNKPIDFTPKKQVSQELLMQCQTLKNKIEGQKRLHIEQQEKLQLLTKYYQLVKSRTISDNLQFPTQHKFDSVQGVFSAVKGRQNLNGSQCSIDQRFQRTSRTNLSKSKSKATFIKGIHSSTSKQQNTQKKIKLTPEEAYNLNKRKSQIAKEMLLEFEVYNLGRIKRVKDQKKLLKKELQFIESQISHFQKSFAGDLKAYQQQMKPKIHYNTFKMQQKQNAYTRSPFSRDYFGNDKGSNNINIYRPDVAKNSPEKNKMDKSLSQSKYTIRRSNSGSQKQATFSLNFSATSNQKISTKKSLTRRVFVPQKADDYGLFTLAQDLNQIKQVPLKQSKSKRFISPKNSRKSLSIRRKNLVRFKTQSQTFFEKKNPYQEKMLQKMILSPTKKQTQLSYNISLEENLSAK